MDFKELRKEVQFLRDELAIMKRQYEDMFYNLDTDNFSSRFVKEQGDMRTAIEVTAEGIKTKVSNEAFKSAIEQTANSITTNVAAINKEFEKYSTIEQTDSKISASVTETKEYVTNTLENGGYVTDITFETQFNICADGIYAIVEETYETKSDANSAYSGLSRSISNIEQTADNISTRVGKVENGQYGEYTLFTQTADTFHFDGKYMCIKSAIQITDNSGNHVFSIFHNEGPPVSDGYRGAYIGGVGEGLTDPLIIGGGNQNVYLRACNTDDNLIATQGWVLENASGTGGTDGYARFG